MLNLQPAGLLTHEAWDQLVLSAKSTIHIAAFYWDLTAGGAVPEYNGVWGVNFYNSLVDASKRGVKIRVAQV